MHRLINSAGLQGELAAALSERCNSGEEAGQARRVIRTFRPQHTAAEQRSIIIGEFRTDGQMVALGRAADSWMRVGSHKIGNLLVHRSDGKQRVEVLVAVGVSLRNSLRGERRITPVSVLSYAALLHNIRP